MRTTPRNLTILRLNDDLLPASRENAPFGGIDVIRFNSDHQTELSAITSWRAALMFWSSFGSDRPPDLVVADVNFEKDSTTPLHPEDAPDTQIPTGLSHLKPIAALARALAQPIGIGIHTGDYQIWRTGIEQRKNVVMGLLAAHEIGELSAILGSDPSPWPKTRDDFFRWCWEWLRDNSKTNFRDAHRIALANYRQQLVERSRHHGLQGRSQPVTMLPDDWARLIAWCERAVQTEPPRLDDDPGLPLLYANGTRDHISLKSLFADAERPLTELPRHCFVVAREEEKPWELDEEDHPRVGAFIHALGSLAESYRMAWEAIRSFPDRPDSEPAPQASLNDRIDSPLVRGLVVLFQVLRRDYANFTEWLDVFDHYEWEPEEIRTTGLRNPQQSLRSCLTAVMRAARGGWHYLDDIAEQLGWHQGLRWHLDLLCHCNVLEHRDEQLGEQYRLTNTPLDVPPVPEHRPDGMHIVGERLREYLRDALGFGGNDHAINTILDQTFTHTAGSRAERERAGSAFLDRFLEGNGPPWLVELCRSYARNRLRWRQEASWPQSIRPTQVAPRTVQVVEKAYEADVMIVGGGMAGLYSAYRLLTENPNQKVILLEALGRLGGRLSTASVQVDSKRIKAEEGGMRFLDQHVHLMWLLRELQIEGQVTSFGMGDENNLYYLRGRRFTRKEAAADNQAIWSELYRLRDAELHKSPTETLAHVVKEIGRSNGRGTGWFPTSIEDWDQLRNEFQYGGRAIYDWPFAPLLSQAGLSDECIQMIRDCGGFAAPYDTSVNAGTALQLMSNFPANPQFNTLRNGYEYLPFRLGQAIRERETGQIWEGYTAESFDITDNGFQLIARNQSSFEQKFSCKKIVLALPRLALERLVEKSPLFKNRQFCKNLESVIPLPLTKINLFYAERWWWNRYGVRNGGSYSTLPLGSVYCYDPDTDDTDGPAVLTIYCDSSRRTYWQGLQDGGKPYNSEMFPDPPASSRPASVEVVQQVQRYLNEMFGAEDIPAPLLATYKAWGSNNEGDANHQWVVGANDQKVREQIWSPLRDVFVCGEAYSNEQCWVEGALRSAECVLQKGFGLSPPFAFHGSPATV